MRELSLRQAFERLSLIDRGLRRRGPQQPGHRFGLLDIMLCFWLEYVNFDDRLAPYPGLLHCRERVTQRPLLQPFFEQLKQWCSDYARLQAAGVGAK